MILGSLFETRLETAMDWAREAERRSDALTDKEWWIGTPFYNPTAAGVNVTQSSALKFSAVFACTRILAESVAFLPLITYKRMKPRGKERATDHPLYSVLHDIANPEMTAYKLRETLQGHLGTWGNAYAEIQINPGGDVMALWPLRPDRMEEIKRGTDGRLRYSYRLPDGNIKVFRQEFILHVKGLGFDGTIGYSPVGMMRQSIALGLATEEHGARFFGNGARPGGVLQHPGKLGPDAYERMKTSWNEAHQGLSNAQRTAILEEGVTYQQVGINPEDAQFLETRKFQVTEIARWYRIPPHMIADLERSTNNNIEHQGIEFVVNTLGPWLVNWEQEIHLNLMDVTERKLYYCEHLVDGLLRGDMQTRFESYAKGLQWGWLNHDDIRERENMNPLPDNQGQVHYMPLNMMPVEAILEEGNSNQEGTRALLEFDLRNTTIPESGNDQVEKRARKAGTYRHRLAMRQVRVFKDMAARIVRRERNDVVAQARKMLKADKPVSEFEQWLVEFYSEHAGWAAKQAHPSMQTYAELVTDAVAEELSSKEDLDGQTENFMKAYAEDFGIREAARSQSRLIELIRRQTDPEEMLKALEERLEDWVENRPAAIALEEAIRVNSAVAVALYAVLGVRKLMSVATGERSCPYCEDLDGRVVGIEDYFLHAGEVFQPPGAEKPLTISADKRHTPWHGGCDCMVVSA